jgi:hypothetical protein
MQSTYPTNDHPWQIGPTASRTLRWIFGFGFFSVHLGIYLIGGLTLLMINLYRSPDDLWVGGPLLRWGVVVVIHFLGAVVTWAVTTAMDVAKTTRRELNSREPYQPLTTLASSQTTLPPVNEPVAPPRPRFQPAVSTPIETVDIDDSRRFGFRGWKSEPDAPRQRTSPPGWTVMRSGERVPTATETFLPPSFERPATTPVTAPPVKEQAPLAGDIGTDAAATAGDSRWTWVEAAAEAWLTNRLDKPSPEPPAPATESAEDSKRSDLE